MDAKEEEYVKRLAKHRKWWVNDRLEYCNYSADMRETLKFLSQDIIKEELDLKLKSYDKLNNDGRKEEFRKRLTRAILETFQTFKVQEYFHSHCECFALNYWFAKYDFEGQHPDRVEEEAGEFVELDEDEFVELDEDDDEDDIVELDVDAHEDEDDDDDDEDDYDDEEDGDEDDSSSDNEEEPVRRTCHSPSFDEDDVDWPHFNTVTFVWTRAYAIREQDRTFPLALVVQECKLLAAFPVEVFELSFDDNTARSICYYLSHGKRPVRHYNDLVNLLAAADFLRMDRLSDICWDGIVTEMKRRVIRRTFEEFFGHFEDLASFIIKFDGYLEGICVLNDMGLSCDEE